MRIAAKAIRIFLSFLVLLFLSSGTARAQEDYDEVYFDEAGGFDSSAMSFNAALEWNEWYGNKIQTCNSFSSTGGVGRFISIRLYVIANGQVIKQVNKTGWKQVSASLSFDPLNSSPAEIKCQLDGITGIRSVDSRSTAFWGMYSRAGWDADSILYFPSAGCSHGGMQSDIVMTNPAPGFPNVNDPPAFAGDEGFFYRGVGGATVSPYYMHYYIPRGTQGPCQAAQ